MTGAMMATTIAAVNRVSIRKVVLLL